MERNSINIKVVVGLFLALFAVSCSSDFLEIEPQGKVSSDNYLKTDDEAFSALVGVYDLMQWNYNRDWKSVYFVKVLPGDDVNCAGSSSTDAPQYQQIDDFTHVSDNPAITAIWDAFYQTIGMTNTIIQRVKPESDVKKAIIAEAKALRAYNYFELATMFGGVPLMTVNPTSETEYSKPRSAKAEVIAQVIKDLTEAIPDLKKKSELDYKFRFSKGAAQATLGKVYLYDKKYAEAASLFQAVIDDNADYDLSTPFGKIWDTPNSLGKESVFAILFSSTEKYNWDNFPWSQFPERGRPKSNIHIQLMGPRDEDFSMGNTGYLTGWGFNLPTKKLYDAFISDNDVVRRKATLLTQAELIAAGGSVKQSSIWDYEGYLRLKYATRESETSTEKGVVAALNYSTAWLLIRTADVYLMAAEAYALSPTPNPTKANEYMNAVRARASLPALSLAGDALMKQIKLERELELAMEGSRFWDLVRWGDASTELASRGFKAGTHNLFPIPLSEISGNTKIDTKDQNPGY
jgi:starch-binding outer membrane protein, SusD/RagB family